MSRLAFKYIIWSKRNENMKAVKNLNNINLKTLAMASKRQARRSTNQPHSQTSRLATMALKKAWIRELQLAQIEAVNDSNYRAIDDISLTQYTNALTTFLRSATNTNNSHIRREWSSDLWIENTNQLIKGSNNNTWSYNHKSSTAIMGKNAGKIWKWWDSWWDANGTDA